MTEPSPGSPEERLAEARERLRSLRTAGHSGPGRNGISDQAPPLPGRGTGTADEERVRATAAGGRLTSLALDPRALRSSPEELGRHIAAAANAALDDLRAQAQAADTEPAIDPAALVSSLRDVQEQGLQQLAMINQSIGEALAKARASMR
ncbi:YbaB/EbfC family nucleoid-associated protein [Actinomadura latina]|uniref:YbaB/EbfC family DNA-binding protein n=1 Tax=Actinomadura latina TaxID=163603 RepID=A0A846Z738_9ACTN|nr:YbaB/EbfC family nucleoid-associated protein [Actinomadura latina]NKZ05956.1 YbaB/EbfC family DNA-binding protein [Actinomadura latina]